MDCSSRVTLLSPCYGLNSRRKNGYAPYALIRSFCSPRFTKSKVLTKDLKAKSFALRSVKPLPDRRFRVGAKAEILIPPGRSRRWWEKEAKPNMLEIQSAQHLVDCVLNAGDKLVIVDFYSPGCGGCRALHPKICQLAESHPDAVFLKVNYEELKKMCYSLHVHVLPFFRFYRGAEGRLCSFSCTNATIKKFKDALEKHGTDRCCLGPTKGLDESDLMKLASAGEISMDKELIPKREEIWETFLLQSSGYGGSLKNESFKRKLEEQYSIMEV